MKEAALTTARSVRGVSGVRNGLIARQKNPDVGAAVGDGVIAAKVRTQLDSEVELGSANDIDLLVNNGIVHLSGVVSSIEEKNLAADVASNVDGVKMCATTSRWRRRFGSVNLGRSQRWLLLWCAREIRLPGCRAGTLSVQARFKWVCLQSSTGSWFLVDLTSQGISCNS